MRILHFRHDPTGRLYWSVKFKNGLELTHNPGFDLDLLPWRGNIGRAWYIYWFRLCLEKRSSPSRQPEDPRHSAVDSPLAPNDGWRPEE